MMVKLLLFWTALLSLSGCSNKEFHLGWYKKCEKSVVVKYKKVYPSIPSENLHCKEIPKPDNNITKQSEVSLYLVELFQAGKVCESNLIYVNILLSNFSMDENSTK